MTDRIPVPKLDCSVQQSESPAAKALREAHEAVDNAIQHSVDAGYCCKETPHNAIDKAVRLARKEEIDKACQTIADTIEEQKKQARREGIAEVERIAAKRRDLYEKKGENIIGVWAMTGLIQELNSLLEKPDA